jgi:hypothetical protein
MPLQIITQSCPSPYEATFCRWQKHLRASIDDSQCPDITIYQVYARSIGIVDLHWKDAAHDKAGCRAFPADDSYCPPPDQPPCSVNATACANCTTCFRASGPPGPDLLKGGRPTLKQVRQAILNVSCSMLGRQLRYQNPGCLSSVDMNKSVLVRKTQAQLSAIFDYGKDVSTPLALTSQ